MDPRKARDPRLARADPRLNSQQPPPTAVWDDASAAAPQHTEPATDVAISQPKYKPRPLFCVVCASNQVRLPTATDDFLTSCRIGQWKAIMCSRPSTFLCCDVN